MQEASGVDFKDLYRSAHLPSILDLATDHSPSSFSRPSFPFGIRSSAASARRRQGRSVSAILRVSLARRRTVLAEI
jgi:hypothetical protein